VHLFLIQGYASTGRGGYYSGFGAWDIFCDAGAFLSTYNMARRTSFSICPIDLSFSCNQRLGGARLCASLTGRAGIQRYNIGWRWQDFGGAIGVLHTAQCWVPAPKTSGRADVACDGITLPPIHLKRDGRRETTTRVADERRKGGKGGPHGKQPRCLRAWPPHCALQAAWHAPQRFAGLPPSCLLCAHTFPPHTHYTRPPRPQGAMPQT